MLEAVAAFLVVVLEVAEELTEEEMGEKRVLLIEVEVVEVIPEVRVVKV